MSIAYSSFQGGLSKINDIRDAVNPNEALCPEVGDPIINIHVSCENVVKLDVASPSDPMCVLFIPVNGKLTEVSRTEVIWNDPNPRWVKFFQSLYIFETHQPLHFAVFDCDSEKSDLSKHDLVGYIDTDVQTLVSAGANPVRFELRHPSATNKRGTLIIQTEQANQSNTILSGQIHFHSLKKLHLFASNSPYLVICKASESGSLIPTFRTEIVKKANSGHWNRFTTAIQSLCNGDLEAPLTFQVFSYRFNKPGEFIGQLESSINSIMESHGHLDLLDKSRKKVGSLSFTNFQLAQKPTFFDYLRSGLQLNLITAIDFTASNRDCNDPRSLHFLQPNAMNSYEQCISAVGSVVCPYDSDQMFPVFGFGGKIGGTVSHCFPLTFDPQNPNVQGLQGILGAYRYSLTQVQLSGPTLFAPVIKAATGVSVSSFRESRTYTILMIITDGVINDMDDTIDAIVQATIDAPLSIIIVGVGNANFSAMDRLDADDVPLVSREGVKMKRDIVQFVPFNKFIKNGGIGLATEVLAEVPRQVHEFCSTHGFIPNM